MKANSRLNAMIIDPADIPAILTTTHQAADQIITAALTSSSQNSIIAADLTSPIISSLSTIITSQLPDLSHAEHIIVAGKSIAPSIEAMTKMGTTYSGTSAGGASALQQLFPNGGEAFTTRSQEAISYGYNIMDGTKIIKGGGAALPGFKEMGSILQPHVIPGPGEESITTPQLVPEPYMFKARLEYATMLLKVLEKVPYVAFGYALLEFFLLRSNVDIYKEDIEDDPAGVFAETVSDVGVRVGLLFVLAVFTYIIF
ncbi:MAG: hypothetical protein ACI8RD_012861 [Bacillariaceae sp.]|jgi:hypothetical protein